MHAERIPVLSEDQARQVTMIERCVQTHDGGLRVLPSSRPGMLRMQVEGFNERTWVVEQDADRGAVFYMQRDADPTVPVSFRNTVVAFGLDDLLDKLGHEFRNA